MVIAARTGLAGNLGYKNLDNGILNPQNGYLDIPPFDVHRGPAIDSNIRVILKHIDKLSIFYTNSLAYLSRFPFSQLQVHFRIQ